MPAPKQPLPESLSWSVRLFAAAPLPPFVSALLVFGVIGVLYMLYAWLTDIGASRRIEEFELLQVAILGFTPAATVYALRGAQHDLADLAPVLRNDAGADALGRVLTIGRPGLRVAGAGGVAIAIFLLFLPASWAAGRPGPGDPVFWWATLRSAALGWLIARTVAIELGVAVGFSKLGEHGVEVDWLDQRPLAPFARKGLRSVLLLLLFPFVFSLFLFEPWGKVVAIPALVLFPALCVFALLLPVSGVHRRLAAARASELGRIDAALRSEAEANLTPGGVVPAGARLSNLVAWRSLVEAAGTWPFDPGVWLRFAVYVSLGLGSWLGGALVERVVSAVLG